MNNTCMHAKHSHILWGKLTVLLHSAISLLRVLISLVKSKARKKKQTNKHTLLLNFFFGITKKFPCFVYYYWTYPNNSSLYFNISPFCFHFFSSTQFFCLYFTVCRFCMDVLNSVKFSIDVYDILVVFFSVQYKTIEMRCAADYFFALCGYIWHSFNFVRIENTIFFFFIPYVFILYLSSSLSMRDANQRWDKKKCPKLKRNAVVFTEHEKCEPHRRKMMHLLNASKSEWNRTKNYSFEKNTTITTTATTTTKKNHSYPAWHKRRSNIENWINKKSEVYVFLSVGRSFVRSYVRETITTRTDIKQRTATTATRYIVWIYKLKTKPKKKKTQK